MQCRKMIDQTEDKGTALDAKVNRDWADVLVVGFSIAFSLTELLSLTSSNAETVPINSMYSIKNLQKAETISKNSISARSWALGCFGP